MKNITKEQYEQICAQFQTAKMYDGRGTLDVYICENCNKVMYSKYIDKGVTPFCIKCERCGSVMLHERTFPVALFPADIEWYRPSFEEFQNLALAEKEHVLNGGLIKRMKTHESK